MSESPTSLIKLQIDAAVATVILDRAEKLHALTPEMIETLAEIAARIDADTTRLIYLSVLPFFRAAASSRSLAITLSRCSSLA